MLADTYNCPVTTLKSEEGPALGVAILALVGAGIYDSIPNACAALVSVGTQTSVNLENVEKYEKFYKKYVELYPALKNCF